MSTRENVLREVEQCVRDSLGNDSIALTEASTASDVVGWDSLAHVRIILAIEKTFKVRFDVDELSDMDSVGALVSALVAKIS